MLVSGDRGRDRSRLSRSGSYGGDGGRGRWGFGFQLGHPLFELVDAAQKSLDESAVGVWAGATETYARRQMARGASGRFILDSSINSINQCYSRLMALRAGALLGPYEILSPLGAGGMGEVYRARDSRLEREVAIKVLPPHLATDPEALGRFEREVKAVAALSHPNILAIHDLAKNRA